MCTLRGGFKSELSEGMRVAMLWSLAVLLCVVVAGLSDEKHLQMNNEYSSLDDTKASGRFFPFFTVVRFPNTHCLGENNLNGTCFTRRECSSYEGIASGTCGNGLGVCCVVQRTCGGSSQLNCTYFVNPNYPSYYSGGPRCTITINKCNSNICQLRLDFLDFSSAQPNVNGVCLNDFLTVSGGSSLVPRICGENTGEHVYVDFDEGAAPIQLSIDTNSAFNINRRWNIKITQIACDSPSKAPVGCLMYYTAISGTVKSFNFGVIPNPAVDSPAPGVGGTRELANLNYGVCVRMQVGYCSIEWSQDPSNNYSFAISGDTFGTVHLGYPLATIRGENCTTDYIVIPHPYENGTSLNYDRFCGNALGTITTLSKPFVLTVVTSPDEMDPASPDNENRGFCLLYRQVPCPL